MRPTTPEEIAERYRELVPQPLPPAECRPLAGRYRLGGADGGNLLNCEFCPQPGHNCTLSCSVEFNKQTSNDGITVTT